MKVADLMTRSIHSCRPDDFLSAAAKIMWENDCGCVPVVDGADQVMAMLTDRDVCMAAYTQNRPLSELRVSSAASHAVFSVRENDHVDVAERLMRRHQVRRLPVLDGSGKIVGVVSINDLVRRASAGRGHESGLGASGIARTLAAIGTPPGQSAAAD